jgi:hypothetical protein
MSNPHPPAPLDSVILTLLREDYKSSSPLRNCLQCPVASSLLGPNAFFSITFLNILTQSSFHITNSFRLPIDAASRWKKGILSHIALKTLKLILCRFCVIYIVVFLIPINSLQLLLTLHFELRISTQMSATCHYYCPISMLGP